MNELMRAEKVLQRPPRAEPGIARCIPKVVVARSWIQLGLLALDGSPSMGALINPEMSKATAVNQATQGLIHALAASSKRANFVLGAVSFDTTATLLFAPTPVANLDAAADFTPDLSGGTFIGSGIALAGQMASKFLAQAWDVPVSVCIVALSDGRDGQPDESIQIARGLLKDRRVRICATHFAPMGEQDTEAETTLRALTRRPIRDYRRTWDAATLRNFFMGSISAIDWEEDHEK